jgi:hypothetical protein
VPQIDLDIEHYANWMISRIYDPAHFTIRMPASCQKVPRFGRFLRYGPSSWVKKRHPFIIANAFLNWASFLYRSLNRATFAASSSLR